MITKSPGKYNTFEEMLADARELYIQLSNETRYKEGHADFPYNKEELLSILSILEPALKFYIALDNFVNPE